MPDRDVTALVEYGLNDDETLPILQCVCGAEHDPWHYVIGMGRPYYYKDDVVLPSVLACGCGRKLYFTVSIKVFEVVEG